MVARLERGDLLARVVRVAEEHAGETTFIGIDGLGAAGKSTLARDIGGAIAGAQIVSVDDFWGHGISEWDWPRFNAEVAVPLAADQAARYRAWDWDANVLGGWRRVEPRGLVIVEGVSATRREVRLPWTLTVWVDTPAAVRLSRARERDGDAMLSRWLDDWMPSEQAYVERERPMDRVDVIVAGH